jgi:hypothetical protein
MPERIDICHAGYVIRLEKSKMKATIDRVEGNLAVLLIGDKGEVKLNIPVTLLPEGSKEGDILDISIIRDEKTTDKTKKRVSNLIDKLKNN